MRIVLTAATDGLLVGSFIGFLLAIDRRTNEFPAAMCSYIYDVASRRCMPRQLHRLPYANFYSLFLYIDSFVLKVFMWVMCWYCARFYCSRSRLQLGFWVCGAYTQLLPNGQGWSLINYNYELSRYVHGLFLWSAICFSYSEYHVHLHFWAWWAHMSYTQHIPNAQVWRWISSKPDWFVYTLSCSYMILLLSHSSSASFLCFRGHHCAYATLTKFIYPKENYILHDSIFLSFALSLS